MQTVAATLGLITACLAIVSLVLRIAKKRRAQLEDFSSLIDWATSLVALAAVITRIARYGWLPSG